MQQVLFQIPWVNIPIYGFGVMLFIAFIVCTWVASRRAEKAGVAPVHIQNLAIYIFVCGILGARITYMIQYKQSITQFFEIWKGGLVFYGSFIGGLFGYALAHYFELRKECISILKVVDIVAPSVAIGLCLGRIGCLLNGCCFGNVACAHCPAIHFPLSAPPRFAYVHAGYQTAAGFSLLERDDDDPRSRLGAVEPGSPAAHVGLQQGDRIVAVNGLANRILVEISGPPQRLSRFTDKVTLSPLDSGDNLSRRFLFDDPAAFQRDMPHMRETARGLDLGVTVYDVFLDLLVSSWPRGGKDVQLSVARAGAAQPLELPAFRPLTIGLHPTQIYESISTLLIFLLLIAYTPFRRHEGEVMALFMICYALHRFLNEMLRNDTDPVLLGMTLSQNGSIIMLVAGLTLFVWAWLKPPPRPALPL